MSNEGFLSSEMAETVIWSFYWQLSQQRDRRLQESLTQRAGRLAEDRHKNQQLEVGLWGKVFGQAERWFTSRKQDEYLERAGADALGELEADSSKRGKVNHATGLPESPNDLGSGREVMRGVDLAMNVILPPFGVACTITHTDETDTGEFIAIAYKPMKKHCQICRALGVMRGPQCEKCEGKGRVRKGKIFLRKQWDICDPCQGHGYLPGPTCEACQGKGAIENWSDLEHETVRHNARAISRAVHKLSERGFFDPDPMGKSQDEMKDMIWEDGTGHTIAFRITPRGYAYMLEFMRNRPELCKKVHLLEYAGEEVRKQAPQWAQSDYYSQR